MVPRESWRSRALALQRHRERFETSLPSPEASVALGTPEAEELQAAVSEASSRRRRALRLAEEEVEAYVAKRQRRLSEEVGVLRQSLQRRTERLQMVEDVLRRLQPLQQMTELLERAQTEQAFEGTVQLSDFSRHFSGAEAELKTLTTLAQQREPGLKQLTDEYMELAWRADAAYQALRRALRAALEAAKALDAVTRDMRDLRASNREFPEEEALTLGTKIVNASAGFSKALSRPILRALESTDVLDKIVQCGETFQRVYERDFLPRCNELSRRPETQEHGAVEDASPAKAASPVQKASPVRQAEMHKPSEQRLSGAQDMGLQPRGTPEAVRVPSAETEAEQGGSVDAAAWQAQVQSAMSRYQEAAEFHKQVSDFKNAALKPLRSLSIRRGFKKVVNTLEGQNAVEGMARVSGELLGYIDDALHRPPSGFDHQQVVTFISMLVAKWLEDVFDSSATLGHTIYLYGLTMTRIAAHIAKYDEALAQTYRETLLGFFTAKCPLLQPRLDFKGATFATIGKKSEDEESRSYWERLKLCSYVFGAVAGIPTQWASQGQPQGPEALLWSGKEAFAVFHLLVQAAEALEKLPESLPISQVRSTS
eukprot:scaffold748_cov251-Pinguiococcus_pyrenoidosus.AAC.52